MQQSPRFSISLSLSPGSCVPCIPLHQPVLRQLTDVLITMWAGVVGQVLVRNGKRQWGLSAEGEAE